MFIIALTTTLLLAFGVSEIKNGQTE